MHDGLMWHVNIYVPQLKCQHSSCTLVLSFQLRDIYLSMSHLPSCVICVILLSITHHGGTNCRRQWTVINPLIHESNDSMQLLIQSPADQQRAAAKKITARRGYHCQRLSNALAFGRDVKVVVVPDIWNEIHFMVEQLLQDITIIGDCLILDAGTTQQHWNKARYWRRV